ncbi:MAG TPA: M48 family metallopeptidase [Bryobacteraceae bacterium]|jgi:Zn-dependent protease with chaperone function
MSTPVEIQRGRVFSANQILLPHISYRSFVYPGDEEALAALTKVPGASTLLIYLQKHFTEGLTFLENNEQKIRAGERSYASLFKLVTRCAEILSCPVPEVYVTTNPTLGAYTVGHRRTSIVLHSSLIESLTADELSFVIGHELGHIKCGHGLYRQLGSLLLQYWDAASTLIPVPGIGLLRIPLLVAYWEWYRRAEHTCDRAGLLCLQNVQPGLTGLGKLAGKVEAFEDEFDVEAAISQSMGHKEVNKLVLVVSILNNAQNTHPFIPMRLKRLREYSQSEDYAKILRGDYIRDPLGLHEGGLRVNCACGSEVNVKLSFCPKCGRSIDADAPSGSNPTGTTCFKCGNQVTPEMAFCGACGARQENVPQPPPAPPGNSPLDKLRSKATGFLRRE